MSDVVIVVARPDAGVARPEAGEDAAPPGAHNHWSSLIPPDPTDERPWSVRTLWLSAGPDSGRDEPGTVRGWDVAPALAGAAVVHVCHPYTSSGEVAVLAARAMGKAVVASDLTPVTSELGRSLDLLRLVHTIVCRSEAEATSHRGQAPVEIVDTRSDGWLKDVTAIHGRMLAAGRGRP